jgi:GH25 family lysozyme M1 (1,4-beta-N-acetylmuramidase)/gas vesicle protein
METITGIDIATYQEQPNFDAVKNSVNFVLARSSYGVGYVDAQFERNRNELRRLNIPHGFYHYAYPQFNEPEWEADYVISILGDLQENEIIALDMEEIWGGNKADWCNRFLCRIRDHFNGYKPLLYTNLSTLWGYDWGTVITNDFGLWVSSPQTDPNEIPSTPWPNVAIKQYSWTGYINGISGNVDLNIFYGNLETFKLYGYHAPQVADYSYKVYNIEEKLVSTVKTEQEALDAYIDLSGTKVIQNKKDLTIIFHEMSNKLQTQVQSLTNDLKTTQDENASLAKQNAEYREALNEVQPTTTVVEDSINTFKNNSSTTILAAGGCILLAKYVGLSIEEAGLVSGGIVVLLTQFVAILNKILVKKGWI